MSAPSGGGEHDFVASPLSPAPGHHHHSHDRPGFDAQDTLDSESEKPSIEKAWEFGRNARPHRIPDPSQPTGFRLMRQGEALEDIDAKPEAYGFFTTSFSQLDEFGIGISLYFRQLIFLSILFFFAGIIYIPTIWRNYKFVSDGVPLILRGSALGAGRSDLLFGFYGMVDFAVCLFLLIFAIVSKKVEDLAAATVDTSQQTTQDYAVVINNPPPFVKDPDEYFDHFKRFGDIVFISTAITNGALLKTLARRREVRAQLKSTPEGLTLLESEKNQSNLAFDPPTFAQKLLYSLGLFSNLECVANEYVNVKSRLEGLTANSNFRVKRVYIIFNTEQAQRACLKVLKLPFWNRVLDMIRPGSSVAGGEEAFHGKALNVSEPVEPSEVNWWNFHTRAWVRQARYLLSTCLSCLVLVISYYLLLAARFESGLVSAVIVSVVNIALPLFMKGVVAGIEVALDQSDIQDSILLKLVVARCFNTAIIKYLVTDYTRTFSEVALNGIMSILIADCVTTPVLSVLNPVGRLKRALIAPRAKTQRQMNLFFIGDEFNLAERYTDMIKTSFLSLFWSAILPVSVFITSASMFVVYLTDKYNLLYQWKRPPALDATLARRSRNFLTITVCCHVVMSRIFYANWPYANGNESPSCNFLFCGDQDAYTPPQRALVGFYNIFGWVVMLVVIWTYLSYAVQEIFSCCFGNVDEVGAASNICFRSLLGAEPYLPLIRSKRFPDPFLAFDISLVPITYLPVCQHVASKAKEVKGLSLCSKRDLPGITDELHRANLFSMVKFYNEQECSTRIFGIQLEAPEATTPIFGSVIMPNPATTSPSTYNVNIPGVQGAIGVAQSILQPSQLAQPVVVPIVVPKNLPAGWVQMLSADGRVYYFHESSNTVQWEDPSLLGGTDSRGVHHRHAGDGPASQVPDP